MKKTTKIILVFLTSLILIVIICGYYLGDKEERFIISDFTADILCAKNKTKQNCFNLYHYDLDSNTNLEKILALKFTLKYLSVKREHLFDHMPPGGEGPIDQIKSIEILYKNNIVIDKSILTDASKYRSFKYNKAIIDISGHSANGNGCLEAETFNNLSDFIYYYNFNSDKDSMFRDVTLRNYHFFKINDSSLRIKPSNLKLKFIMRDGRIITREVR